MANIELLEKTLQHIKDHPETWDQSKWHCGTTFCFAGHAAALDLQKPLVFEEEDALSTDIIPRNGPITHLSDYAQEALGLTDDQRDALFDGENTLDDLQAIITVLKTFPDVVFNERLCAYECGRYQDD